KTGAIRRPHRISRLMSRSSILQPRFRTRCDVPRSGREFPRPTRDERRIGLPAFAGKRARAELFSGRDLDAPDSRGGSRSDLAVRVSNALVGIDPSPEDGAEKAIDG